MRGNSDSAVLITAVWWLAVKDSSRGSCQDVKCLVNTSRGGHPSARDGGRPTSLCLAVFSFVFGKKRRVFLLFWHKYNCDLKVFLLNWVKNTSNNSFKMLSRLMELLQFLPKVLCHEIYDNYMHEKRVSMTLLWYTSIRLKNHLMRASKSFSRAFFVFSKMFFHDQFCSCECRYCMWVTETQLLFRAASLQDCTHLGR